MTDDRIRNSIADAMKPIEDAQLKRDLWPEMLRRLDRQPIRISVWDWALIAALLIWVVLFPQGALTLLYHL